MERRKILDISFLVIEFILYILIFSAPYARITSYLSIVFCFIYTLTFINYNKNTRVNLLRLGLATTLVADFFLVLLGGYKEAAMFSFSITQIAYALLLVEYSKHVKIETTIRVIGTLSTLVVTYIVLKDGVDMLSLLSMFYYFNLVFNAVLSFIHHPSVLFKIGLVLFICCDTVIGLQNLGGYIPLSQESIIYKIIYVDFNLPWIFYLPSQVLISFSINSILKEEEVFEKEKELIENI